MLCIGYGRFIPVLLSEAFVTNFTMVTGATFYALFIANAMAHMLQNENSKTSYLEKVKRIEEYLRYEDVPNEIKDRVETYFHQKYSEGRYFNENYLLSQLSKPIKDDIILYTCRDVIQKVSFLKHATPEFISALLGIVSSDVYLSDDVIIREGSTDSKIYFVRNGNLVITVGNKTIMTLSEGACFGESNALTRGKRLYTVTARTTCNIFFLSSNDLLAILDNHVKMRYLIEHVAIDRLLRIFKRCDLARLDERRSKLTSVDDGIIHPFKVTLAHLLKKKIHSKHVEKLKSIRRASKSLKLSQLFANVVRHHRSTHMNCNVCLCEINCDINCDIHGRQ